jgi:putative ABC transport system permease protein
MAHAWLRIARRELRGGIAGFWIYLACLALGAWAIAAAGSVTQTFSEGLTRQSELLLGGNAQLTITQREATDEERAWMDERGVVSTTISLDMMARGAEAVAQSDTRGVDDKYPLVGQVGMAPKLKLADALAKQDGAWGVLGSQSLLDKLKIKVGDRFELSGHPVQLRAVLLVEPDRMGVPGAFQPRIILSLDALREFGEVAQGRLFRVGYRMIVKPEYVDGFEKTVRDTWGEAGMRYRDPKDAVEGMRDLLARLNSFMSVVGIAALVAGGVGVAQATSSFLETRVESIAALKALGADAGTIRAAYALQLLVLAGFGAFIGIALGALSPWLLQSMVGNKIPLPTAMGIYPEPLLKGFALAMLAAVMFAAPALGRARATPPAALFRRQGSDFVGKTPLPETLISIAAGIGLALLAILTSKDPVITGGLLIAAGGAYGVLAFAAWVVKRIAKRASKGARGYMRLALANLGGPGSLASVVAPALGIGLALTTMIAVVQTNLLGQIRDTAPANAPAVIFRQVPHDAAPEFDAVMKAGGVKTEDGDAYRRAPFILGRVIKINGTEIDEDSVAPEERWVVRGETSMTFLANKPPEANIRSGKWWKPDYTGPALVSVEEGAARGLRVKVGDKIGFRIFGREVEAEVGSIRKVDWGGFGTNVAFILSPGTLEAAKPFHTAIVKIEPGKEDALVKAVADRWPGILAFQLRRTLETAADLFNQVSLIVTALAGVVTTAGVLVLFGAFAAAARRRRQDSALLKVFGASRPAILALYAFEFALAGLAAALLGAAMGIIAAHPIVINAFEAHWRFAWWPVVSVGGVAVLAAAAGGVAVGWATLSHRPARVLRSA